MYLLEAKGGRSKKRWETLRNLRTVECENLDPKWPGPLLRSRFIQLKNITLHHSSKREKALMKWHRKSILKVPTVGMANPGTTWNLKKGETDVGTEHTRV